MAKTEFKDGIKCTKCGHMIIPDVFSNSLCQKCGARILAIDLSDRTFYPVGDGKPITIKRTHKLFHNVLEEV